MSAAASESVFDPGMCRQCRGLCCQGHPGVWVDPEAFLQAFGLPRPVSAAVLDRMLPDGLHLREIDGVAVPAPKKIPTGCVFLTEDGCRLPAASRPGQCLALVPSIDTLIDGEIRCELRPEGSTLAAIWNWRLFWAQP